MVILKIHKGVGVVLTSSFLGNKKRQVIHLSHRSRIIFSINHGFQ